MEYASSDFLLSILNTGCFIRYYTTLVDVQPSQWVMTSLSHIHTQICTFFHFSTFMQESRMVFKNNTAMLAGAGIYANDMSRCKWLGNITQSYTIFQIPLDMGGPFYFANNTVQGVSGNRVTNNDLATESSQFSATINDVSLYSFNSTCGYSYCSFFLSSTHLRRLLHLVRRSPFT